LNFFKLDKVKCK